MQHLLLLLKLLLALHLHLHLVILRVQRLFLSTQLVLLVAELRVQFLHPVVGISNPTRTTHGRYCWTRDDLASHGDASSVSAAS